MSARQTILLVALAFAAVPEAAGCAEAGGVLEPPCPVREGIVSRVIDGDTLELSVSCSEDADCPNENDSPGRCLEDGRCDRDSAVRLVGVNAGEIEHGSPDESPPECLGQEARQELERLVQGKQVRLVYEPIAGCRDQYQRLLAYVFIDEELVQSRMLGEGLICTFWASSRPDKQLARFYDVLRAAEELAVTDEAGIWSPGDEICGGLPRYPHKCERR